MSSPAGSSIASARSNRSGMSWNTVEQEIRKLARAAVEELTKEEARRLYQLELSASRHAGESPAHLLKRARNVLP